MTTWTTDAHARKVVENAQDAVVVADAEGVIRVWNRAAERIFGYTGAEAIGQSLDLIIPERQRERHWQGYARVMASGETKYKDG
jgi:PAS domain S-box-containing protein